MRKTKKSKKYSHIKKSHKQSKRRNQTRNKLVHNTKTRKNSHNRVIKRKKNKRRSKRGGHPIIINNEKIHAWKRLPTCTGVDCAFNTFSFLYGEDPEFLKQARERVTNPAAPKGVSLEEQLKFLDKRFPYDKPHREVVIMRVSTTFTDNILRVAKNYLLNELLYRHEALPLNFFSNTKGHSAIIARDNDDRIIYFDPQSQSFLIGFQQIGEFMLNLGFTRASVIVPQRRIQNENNPMNQRIKIFNLNRSEVRFVRDIPRQGFKLIGTDEIVMPLPPDPKYAVPGAPGQRIYLPKALTPGRQHLKDHTFSANSWVPISDEFPIAIIQNCNVEDKWEDWNNYCPEEGGLHGQQHIGCIFNVLGFLNVISIPEARREVEDVNVGPGISTPFNSVLSWFNSAKQDRPTKYIYQSGYFELNTSNQDLYKAYLKKFFDQMVKKMPINSCTLIQLERPSPNAGHYIILSKTSRNKLVTIDPQLSKKSEYKNSVDKFYKLYWNQKFLRINFIIAYQAPPRAPAFGSRQRGIEEEEENKDNI